MEAMRVRVRGGQRERGVGRGRGRGRGQRRGPVRRRVSDDIRATLTVLDFDATELPHEFINMDEAGFNLAKTRRRGHNFHPVEDRIHHAGMDGLLRNCATGFRVDEAFTMDDLVDSISADTSGLRCGHVQAALWSCPIEDRIHHAGMDGLLRNCGTGCRVNDVFTMDDLVDSISADTSGLRCGRVMAPVHVLSWIRPGSG
ncbi:hypothetical protein DPX16_8995 [Anabarilius grahami]|uniref:Uncharacterized protein n=1 Tax=Anabarilius grahami TaxID=495550 RepID=A0A3N0XCU1_ANAGA|nr:hypothetical protein DPX16_8995 [Anabarilius grahami]